MPTLLNRSAELSAKLEQVENREFNHQRYSQLTPILNKLISIADDFNSKTQIMSLFAANNVPVASANASTAIDKLEKLQKKFEKSPDTIAQGNQWAEAQTALAVLTRSIDSAMTAAWKGFVDGNTPGIDLLQPYAGLGAFRQVFQRLQSLRNEATVSKHNLPAKQEDFNRVTQRKQEMEAAIHDFGLQGEPEDCQNLLRRCATAEGVPLGELTFDQLKWLIDKGFAKSLRIKSI
jgi:hypothetical protein